jgi:hypothetical protein
MADPRYPIGPFEWHKYHTPEERLRDIEIIGDTPQRLRLAVKASRTRSLILPIATAAGRCGRSCIISPTAT